VALGSRFLEESSIFAAEIQSRGDGSKCSALSPRVACRRTTHTGDGPPLLTAAKNRYAGQISLAHQHLFEWESLNMTRSIYDRKVSDIMTRDVVTLEAGGTVHEALTLMGENRVSAIPVVDRKGRCVGILSATDLVDMTRDVDDDLYHLDLVDSTSRRFLIDRLSHTLGEEAVDTYMSESVTTVLPDSTLVNATRKILKAGIHHLPVVDEKDRLVGIVSSIDILAEFVDGAPQ